MIDQNSFKIHFFTPDDKFVARRSLFYIADVENNRLKGLKQLIIDQPFISTGKAMCGSQNKLAKKMVY